MTRSNGEKRAVAARAADHAAIGRLTDELLPSLIAKLGASGLGEIEVREGEWHVRLRGQRGAGKSRPSDRPGTERGDRAGRSQPGHEGHGHAPGVIEARHATEGRAHDDADGGAAHRATATSPAVGVFQPRQGVTAGAKVRQGDKVGYVEMLGIPQEVLSPVDGIVGANLVEAGQAVEYGQDLIEIELAEARAEARA